MRQSIKAVLLSFAMWRSMSLRTKLSTHFRRSWECRIYILIVRATISPCEMFTFPLDFWHGMIIVWCRNVCTQFMLLRSKLIGAITEYSTKTGAILVTIQIHFGLWMIVCWIPLSFNTASWIEWNWWRWCGRTKRTMCPRRQIVNA